MTRTLIPALSRRSRATTVAALCASALLLGAACSSDNAESPIPDADVSVSELAIPVLPVGQPNPMIAEGVTITSGAHFYKSSGLGPEALNTDAEPGTPESYINPAYLSDGELSGGVTVTEAQGINTLERIRANLEARGLTLSDVVSMRVFLAAAPGEERADYAGWNRAYRQFFANTDLESGDTVLVPLGDGEPGAPIERNGTRPSRFALEVASLPVEGWLVEVEVDAVYPDGVEPN